MLSLCYDVSYMQIALLHAYSSNPYVKHPYKMVRMSRKLKMLKIWCETKKSL